MVSFQQLILSDVCLLSDEDEGKGEDAQSMVSGGEEYEPISDDELDEILADSAQKRDDQQDDERVPGASMTRCLCRNMAWLRCCVFVCFFFNINISIVVFKCLPKIMNFDINKDL